MEIRISGKNIVQIVLIASIVLASIGFLMVLFGIISILTVDTESFDGGIENILTGASVMTGGVAISVVSYCLGSSVAKLKEYLDAASNADDDE